MRPYFIAASGTNVGKTHVTSTLCWQLREMDKKVTALKPVMTGYAQGDEASDAAVILKSSGLEPSRAMVEAISRWRYAPALSPNMAAAEENRPPVEMGDLLHYCREHAALDSDIVLVEGVGGIMVPLNDTHTTLEWMQGLGWPVILVVGSYLGTISHTLTAVEVLRQHRLPIAALVVNQSPNSDVRIEDTVATFEKFVSDNVPIVKLPRVDKAEPWKHMPRITWMVDA